MKKFLFSIFFVLCLSSCSTGFVYNNLDWLVHWYIDDYVDLNAEQEAVFDDYMRQWLNWHRSEELVAYRQHLQELKSRIEHTPLDRAQWLSEFERGRTHWNRLLQEVAGDLSTLALKLDDKQIESIFDELEKRNREREQRQKSRDDSRRTDKLQEDIVQWIGPLSKPQKELLRRYSGKLKPNFKDWMQYRRKWQSEARQILLQREDTERWRRAMDAVVLDPRQFEHQTYREQSAYNRNVYASLLADLHAGLSERQKAHLQEEIEDLIRDLSDLMGDG
ncbi:DUF6279 family lipoprotein [Lacimicrobium alkaliphilum]|uniref:Lipoprotein n=1 Tax=Lacimicrobium alkaliphilum TaxID=1526571 RepID=A0A0U3B4S5_9ALTE|nr:DUF6279 family lipoprotein [Lacimicrobium alkaliphilum]ALS98569.1 hypothetical protein AT746_10030 [Lacimicrobium alkaliphilum]